MKRLLQSLLAVLVCTCALARTSGAEEPTKEPVFQGIKWSSSQAVVREAVGKLKGFVPMEKVSTSDVLVYTGGELGGQKVALLHFLFDDQGLLKVGVLFDKPSEHRLLTQYKEIQDMLVQRYGKASQEYRTFLRPYYEGDGYETQAIRLGKASIASFWNFPAAVEASIMLRIDDTLRIMLVYEGDSARSKRYSEKRQQEKANDF